MQRDPEIQLGPQTFLFPLCRPDKIGQLQGEVARYLNIRKDEIETITPGVLCDD